MRNDSRVTRRTALSGLASLGCYLAAGGRVFGGGDGTPKARYTPSRGPVQGDGKLLLHFDDESGGDTGAAFGCFYRDDRSPAEESIEQTLVKARVPGREPPLGLMAFPYCVRGPRGDGIDAWCGVWIKPGGNEAVADLSRFAGGDLVLVLARLRPGDYKRNARLDSPETEALSNFKLELKAKDEVGRQPMTALRQYILPRHQEEQRKTGTFEIRVPLARFALDLSHINECVIVVEGSKLPANERQGAFAIRTVAVTVRSGQDIASLLERGHR